MTALIHRAITHDSARACLIVIGLFAAMGVAELFCTLTGVPA